VCGRPPTPPAPVSPSQKTRASAGAATVTGADQDVPKSFEYAYLIVFGDVLGSFVSQKR